MISSPLVIWTNRVFPCVPQLWPLITIYYLKFKKIFFLTRNCDCYMSRQKHNLNNTVLVTCVIIASYTHCHNSTYYELFSWCNGKFKALDHFWLFMMILTWYLLPSTIVLSTQLNLLKFTVVKFQWSLLLFLGFTNRSFQKCCKVSLWINMWNFVHSFLAISLFLPKKCIIWQNSLKILYRWYLSMR